MSLTLRLTSPSTIPICVQGVLPENTTHQSKSEIARRLVWHGNRQLPLADLFEVIVEPGSPESERITWEGELSSVHWIGSRMTRGQLVVNGNVGRHLGSQMIGGTIHVKGSASDYVGGEMTGGSIHIAADASDWVGAAYPGTTAGMKGGTIFVDGNVSNGAGFGLRRGTICVAGNAQRLAGWNMLAGTIIVGKQIGAMAGKGMVRGTLLLPNHEFSAANIKQLPPTFTTGGRLQPVVLDTLRNWLHKMNPVVKLTRSSYQMFHGDHLRGGRGEVFVGVP